MSLVTLENVSIRFRGPNLLDEVNCRIEPRQRIGLLGRNGAGKSTLMKLITGKIEPDHGEILVAPSAHVAELEQDVPRDWNGTLREIVTTGIQHLNEVEADWKRTSRIDQALARMNLDPDARFETLSSGMKRRVLLARAIVGDPELLLLDEPTNHLDIASIQWLESLLLKWPGTLLFVTHDRTFLRNLATRILEIDRGKIFDWSCDYDKFLERKEAALEAEEKQQAEFDKKLAEEEAWIRRGVKARRTRNQGRVRHLKKMREERGQRQDRSGAVNLKIQSGQRSGNKVAQVKEISFAYADRSIVRDFSCEILRGDKIGLIGPNGAGKTTLLRLLLGELKPHSGSVKLGHNLEVAYFDQLRDALDESQSVEFNVADGYQNVTIDGRSKHVLGYLQDFLFSPERARTEVRFLSGGERNRLLLAKLFAKPANVLVLDEPTNDLDTETLELLEEKLVDFDGTVLVVSHDRSFLNNVVTSTIVFENDNVREYDGGYDDWVRQSGHTGFESGPSDDPDEKPPQGSETKKEKRSAKTRKLSFREKQELESLPQRIESLEADVQRLHDVMADPDFYKNDREEISAAQEQLTQLNHDLETAFARWEELEAIA